MRHSLNLAGLPMAFWAALLVLTVNDHVLKGSGLLPSTITGKLSDFAGLIVAPVLLCAALSVRTDRARGALIALVAAGFAAIKLSPALAHGAGQALTAIGIPSRIWCDPTDLIAFAVLPLAAKLAQGVQPMPARLSRRLAIGLASLACLATSEDGPMETELHPPFLINWTHSALEVRVTRAKIPCDGSDEDDQNMEVVQRYTLGPAQMAQLGEHIRSDGDPDAASSVCGQAEIEVGGARYRVRWEPHLSARMNQDVVDGYVPDQDYVDTWQVEHDAEWAFERGITIYGSASEPLFEVGELLEDAAP